MRDATRSSTMVRLVRSTVVWLFIWTLLLPQCRSAQTPNRQAGPGRNFFVDADAGSDAADGLAPERAWQSLARVNSADFRPGDTVRFKRGGVWRGSLIPTSGDETAPVTYAAFGQGAKPRLLGSRERNRDADWVAVGERIWATVLQEYRLDQPILDLRDRPWTRYQEATADTELSPVRDRGEPFFRLVAANSGTAPNHVQLWGPALSPRQGACLVLTFRARSTKPFRFPGVRILQARSPWASYARPRAVTGVVDTEWRSFQAACDVERSADDARLHISLGGLLPANTVFDFQPLGVHPATPTIADPLDVDVGNLIFDGGAVCGWKKWSRDDLREPYDYWYDPATQRVFLCCDVAPTSRHTSIELALARHVVNQTGKHHIVYDSLAVMYGAAHGFGGGETHHLTIRDCDLAYIGGAHQFTTPEGKPVRYGNAIEFWGAAHDNLVEGCHIWEVYDAALTNQGRGPDSRQINITYRNNLVRNAEYSFEYWNHPDTAVTQNIRFINNTCIGAGRGWAHAQRPDPNGSHLMFYSNTAATSGIEIKYNVFYDYTDWGTRYTSGWRELPELDFNLWYSESGVMAYWFRERIATFDEYRRTTGLDAHSRFADPQFNDAARGDYRLRPDSPARGLRPDGGSIGADLPER